MMRERYRVGDSTSLTDAPMHVKKTDLIRGRGEAGDQPSHLVNKFKLKKNVSARDNGLRLIGVLLMFPGNLEVQLEKIRGEIFQVFFSYRNVIL